MTQRQVLLWGLGGIGGTFLLLLVGAYAWVLLAREPLSTPVSRWLPWPVACSTRGCITTRRWHDYLQATERFAQATRAEAPSSATVLTTLIRQHLAHHAHLRSPVSRADAIRYRQEILHAENEEQVQEYTSLSLAQYDEQVLIPLLEQESLRQQRKAETPDDLYAQLAAERWVAVLPWFLAWDSTTASIVPQ